MTKNKAMIQSSVFLFYMNNMHSKCKMEGSMSSAINWEYYKKHKHKRLKVT